MLTDPFPNFVRILPDGSAELHYSIPAEAEIAGPRKGFPGDQPLQSCNTATGAGDAHD